VYRHPVPTTPHRRPLIALLTGAVTLPVVLGSCSSSSTVGGSTTTTQAGHHVTNSVCSLVTPAQIEQMLGKPVGTPGVTNSARLTVCSYRSKAPTDVSGAVIIGFRGQVTSTEFTSEKAKLGKAHGTTTDVGGSGDQAYYYSVDAGGHTVISLATLVNRTQVTITSTATVDQSESLARAIFATFANQATTTAP